MRFAFVLFKYFPFGGLQRDMISIAQVALARGHQVSVLCSAWEGEQPANLEVIRLPASGITNAARMRSFAKAVNPALGQQDFDLTVGFNKLPGLQVYYAADSCFAAKAYGEKSWWYRFTPRARSYLSFEEAVFGNNRPTRILELSGVERAFFQKYYRTPDSRFYTLPPGIWRQHRRRATPEQITALRRELDIADDQLVLLAVGSGFRTKGLDRSIQLLADWQARKERPAVLLVAGQDKPDAFARQAAKLKVDRQLRFLGGRDDVPELLQLADALLHPARKENTGNALLEAMIAGCPVIATELCGYSDYIREADMGVVMASPFDPQAYLTALDQVVCEDRALWRERGRHFAERDELYARSDRAVDLLEQFAGGEGSS